MKRARKPRNLHEYTTLASGAAMLRQIADALDAQHAISPERQVRVDVNLGFWPALTMDDMRARFGGVVGW